MISKGKSKTVAEKDWLDQVVDFAMYSDWLSGMYYTSCNHPRLRFVT